MGATIRIGREILCLPYAGFFLEINSFYRIDVRVFQNNLGREGPT